jgi:hypothetical protein
MIVSKKHMYVLPNGTETHFLGEVPRANDRIYREGRLYLVKRVDWEMIEELWPSTNLMSRAIVLLEDI